MSLHSSKSIQYRGLQDQSDQRAQEVNRDLLDRLAHKGLKVFRGHGVEWALKALLA